MQTEKIFKQNMACVSFKTLRAITVAILVLGTTSLATAQILSVPITGTVAGGVTTAAMTAGSYCSGTSGPTSFNTVGDGCPATLAYIASAASTANAGSVWTDSLGNIYFADYTDFEVRVIYRGGATLAAIIAVNNPSLTGAPQPGYVYVIAGALGGGSLVSPFYCNKVSGNKGLDVLADGCPAYQAYSRPFSGVTSADGDIYYLNNSQSARMQVQVVYGGGAQAAKLIALESGVTSPVIGYVYRIGGGITGAMGYSGDGGLASAAAFSISEGIALDSAGDLFIADTNNNVVRKISGATGIVTAFAGGSATGCVVGTAKSCPTTESGDGAVATAAGLSAYDVAMDVSGNVYIADAANKIVRAIYVGGTLIGISNPTAGYIYKIAGGGASTASGTTALGIQFNTPKGVSFDQVGNLYVADTAGDRIWKIDHATGIGTIFAGTGSTTRGTGSCSGTTGPVATNTIGDACPATLATLNGPIRHVAFDQNDVAYVSDSLDFRVRSLDFNSKAADTAVGSSTSAYVSITSPASFTAPALSFTTQGTSTSEFTDTAVTCVPGTAYTANTVCSYNVEFSPAIAGRRIAQQQFVAASTTVLTTGVDGRGLSALLAVGPNVSQAANSTITQPASVTADSIGNIYISDTANGAISKGVPGGTFTTVATGLVSPAQTALDAAGNLYVADAGNNRIAELPAGGTVTTLISGLSSPMGIVSNGTGVLFISDSGNKRVLRYDQGTLTALSVAGLGTPGALALDSTGNLYIADTANGKIVTFGTQAAVSISATIAPTGLAVDAAGDLYIADKSSESILMLPSGTSNPVTLSSGLSAAAGLGLDAAGDVFYADSSAGIVNEIAQASAVLPFAKTNEGELSSSSTLTLVNIGNQPLTFTAPNTYVGTGDTADFVIAQGTTPCNMGTIAPAANCTLAAQFAPVSVLGYTDTLIFPSNAVGTAKAVLTGTGENLIKTTMALTLTSPASGNVSYLQSATFTATITQASTGAALTGSLVIRVDGTAMQTITLTGTTAQFNLTFLPGMHVVTATYSGDTVYASSFNTYSLTVIPQATTSTFAYTAALQTSSPSLLFTAHVAGVISGVPTGTVSFYNGTTLLKTVALTQGTATYSTNVVVYPDYGFTIVYSGDTNYTTSTSPTLTLAPDFSMVASTTTINAAAGVAATATLTLTPYFNYTATITTDCTGMPQNAVCRFTPQTLTFTPGVAQMVTIGFYTNVSSQVSQVQQSSGGLQLAFLLAPFLAFAGLSSRMRRSAGQLTIVLMLALAGLLTMSGCSGTRGFAPGQTPAGTSTVTATITDGTTSHSITYTLNVVTGQ